jgi:uncharacterized protein
METVAVIGASGDRHKFGNKCVRAYRQAGWEVFPVNPRESEIEGLPVFAAIADVPVRPDRVALYLPPERTRAALAAIAEKGTDEVYLNPGTWDEAVLAEADRLHLTARRACAIVAIGMSPSQFP